MIRAIFKHKRFLKHTQKFIACRSSYSTAVKQDFFKDISKYREYSEIDGYVWNSPYEKISLPDMTIDQYVWKNVAKWKNHVAIVCGVTGRKYTYGKLRDHCAALAIYLREKFGLEQNDIVAICLPNVPEYPIALLGSIEAGLVVTTVNPWYTAEEISRQLISSQPKVIFSLVENYAVIEDACKLANQSSTKIIAVKTEITQTVEPHMINFFDLINTRGLSLSDAKYNEKTSPESVCLLPYSSGTTGWPKGVMLSHNNLSSNCEALDVKLPFERLIFATTNDYQEVLPCVLPFYHLYGLLVILLSKLALGCKIVSIPKFELNQFLKIVSDHKSTQLYIVPPIVILLANSENAKESHFAHVHQVMSAASSLAQSDAERFRLKANHAEFFQGYGLTETSPIATITPKGLHNYDTIGWPISNVQAKIVNIDDATFSKGLNTHESGELLFRGPNIMKGYFKNEEATRAMISSDGWLRTGDIGHYDENGLLYISDRLKELIKVNALQVAPAELEGILRTHPAILDAVVVGIPNATYGEVPKAFVVRRPDADVTESDVKVFVSKQVAKHKQLTGGVQFVESIPKTVTGKILRREIKKLYC